MIAFIRQFLTSFIVLGAGLLWSAPAALIAVSVILAVAIDTFLIGPSPEMALYRTGLDFDAQVPRRMAFGEGICLLLATEIFGGLLTLIPQAWSAGEILQQMFGMAAVLLVATAISYCGTLSRPHSRTCRELLIDIDRLPYPFILLEFLPQRPRRAIGAILTIAVGALPILAFVALSGLLHLEPWRTPMLLVMPLLAFFFHLGFVSVVTGLLLLVWIRGPGREPAQWGQS